MDELRTEQFNNQYDKIFRAALSLKHWNRIYRAHTPAERDLVLRRNTATQAAWTSLFREFDER
jgi:hypothetical protein